MQPHTDIQQLKADRQSILKLIQDPLVPEQRKGIYRQTLANIEAQLSPPKNPNTKTATTLEPSPEPVKKTAAPADSVTPAPIVFVKTEVPEQTYAPLSVPDKMEIIATLNKSTKMVSIYWDADQSEEIGEGMARSRFTTCLRDMADSKKAAQGRWEDIKSARTFQRACAYYSALAIFWGRQPTALELEITPLGIKKTILFNMIKTGCEQLNS